MLTSTAWNDYAWNSRVALLNLPQLDTAQAIERLTAAGLHPEQARLQFDVMLQNQAVMLATDQIFFLLGILLALASFTIWLTKRPKAAGGGGH